MLFYEAFLNPPQNEGEVIVDIDIGVTQQPGPHKLYTRNVLWCEYGLFQAKLTSRLNSSM